MKAQIKKEGIWYPYGINYSWLSYQRVWYKPIIM